MSGVIVIGFDAMDPGIATTMARSGSMPVLAALLERSAWTSTRNPDGLYVGGLWPSFATSTWPARHGWYCFRQLRSGSYLVGRRTPHDVVGPAFWEALTLAGLRCCVIDAPLAKPTEDVTLQIVDWGTHDRILPQGTWPPDEEVTTLGPLGPHAVVGRCDDYSTGTDLAGLQEALARAASAKTDLSIDLLGREDWDLFLTVYGESHCAGHQFWTLHDASWTRHDSTERERLGDALEATYQRLDHELGRLLEHAASDAAVVLLLSHGMGPHHDGDHLLAEVVRRFDDAFGAPSRWRRWSEVIRRRFERAGRTLGRRRRPADGRLVGLTSLDGARRFLTVPNNGLYGGIRLNLVGREPRGRISDDQLDDMLSWVSERLLELVDADDGRPVVHRVLRTDDLFDGDQRDALPDLLVDWHRDRPITSASSATVGEVRGQYDGPRSGDHRPSGLVAVSGPGVTPGRLDRSVDIVDLGPTIANRLGVQLSAVEGHPVSALLPAGTSPAQR